MTTVSMDCSQTDSTINFDLQSLYTSFEERRWIAKQRQTNALDPLVKAVTAFHSQITGHENFSVIPQTHSMTSLMPLVDLKNTHSLYEDFPINGLIDNEVDQFRLYHQQTFQLICADLSKEKDYQIFFTILEGLLFYVASTVDKYKSLYTHELRRCFSSFTSFIQTRTDRMLVILRCFHSKRSFPRYKLVHSYTRNNCGVLFQLLPKIPGLIPPQTECHWMLSADAFGNEILSPEELRFIDYLVNLKQKDLATANLQPKTMNDQYNLPIFTAGLTGTNRSALTFPVLHCLPIIYPYNERMTYDNKFPTFWTKNHQNDDANTALFQTSPLNKGTSEYIFVERSFYKTVDEKKLQLAYIERIENPHLWQKFSAHRSYMRRKNGTDNLNEQWMFHGTKSDNQHQIIAHGFNRSYCKDGVLYGRGVYFSRFAAYSVRYSDQIDLSCIFLCRVLVGHYHPGVNDMHVPPTKTLPNGASIQVDSTTDPKDDFTIAVTYHDDQNYPEYIIGYTKIHSKKKL